MHHCPRTPILSRLTALPVLLLGALITSGAARAAAPPDADARLSALQQTLEQMQAALKQLSEENRALREHQEEVDRKLTQLGAGAAPAAAAVAQAAPAAAAPSGSALPQASTAPAASAAAAPGGSGLVSSLSSGLRLWGYGEVYFTDPVHDRNQAQADLARAVFGIGYAFDERTEFNSEFEVEHAVASADDVGEFEVEQFYVDHQLNDGVDAARRPVPDAVRAAERAPRADQLLRRAAQLRRDADHPEHLARGRHRACTAAPTSGLAWNVGLTTGLDLVEVGLRTGVPAVHERAELEDNGHRAAAGHAPGARARQLAQPRPVPLAELLRRAGAHSRGGDQHG